MDAFKELEVDLKKLAVLLLSNSDVIFSLLVVTFVNNVDVALLGKLVSCVVFIASMADISVYGYFIDKKFDRMELLSLSVLIVVILLFTCDIRIILFTIFTLLDYCYRYERYLLAYVDSALFQCIDATMTVLNILLGIIVYKVFHASDIWLLFLVTIVLSRIIVCVILGVRLKLLSILLKSIIIFDVLNQIKILLWNLRRFADATISYLSYFMVSLAFVSNIKCGREYVHFNYKINLVMEVIYLVGLYLIDRYTVYLTNNKLEYSSRHANSICKLMLILHGIALLCILFVNIDKINELGIWFFTCMQTIAYSINYYTMIIRLVIIKRDMNNVLLVVGTIGLVVSIISLLNRNLYVVSVLDVVSCLLAILVYKYMLFVRKGTVNESSW